MDDPYDLARFVEAQRGTYEQACAELRRGWKTGHWIWFIFPQMKGLGMSAMSERYGIGSLAEARAYLGHSILGPRLREISGIALAIEGRTVEEIFGWPDDAKLRSSMTLFAAASGDERVFVDVLAKYFGGVRDQKTMGMVG